MKLKDEESEQRAVERIKKRKPRAGKKVILVSKTGKVTVYNSLIDAAEDIQEAKYVANPSRYLGYRINKQMELVDGSRLYWFKDKQLIKKQGVLV